jgi:sporulation protein YqfC
MGMEAAFKDVFLPPGKIKKNTALTVAGTPCPSLFAPHSRVSTKSIRQWVSIHSLIFPVSPAYFCTVREGGFCLLDLPQDVVFDLPRLTMIGDRQLYIENHRGVLHFSSDRLRLALSKGELEVTGDGLVIRTIWTEEVFVEGQIKNIEMRE